MTDVLADPKLSKQAWYGYISIWLQSSKETWRCNGLKEDGLLKIIP
jgi:hypothetical protein